MILDKYVQVTCSRTNKKFYEDKGYVPLKLKQEFTVKVSDLPLGSQVLVRIKCGGCGAIKYLTYSNYNKTKSVKLNGRYLCFNCMPSGHPKLTVEYVAAKFLELNYTPMFNSYSSNKKPLPYICNTHVDKGLQYITYASIRSGCGCYWCGVAKKSGANNVRYNGLTKISEYARNKIDKWKYDSILSNNFICDITKLKFDVVHHLVPFAEIIKTAHQETNIGVKPVVSGYTESELNDLINCVIKLHEEGPLGVCLTAPLHKKFHEVYGVKDFKPEDYYEFKNDCLRGKYDIAA